MSEPSYSSYLDDPDVELMLSFQKGNSESFDDLMRRYYPRILNFIYRFVAHRATAEDLTQEVFLRVFQSAPRYRPESKFQTWIFTIAKNLCLNHVTRVKQHLSLDESRDESLPGYAQIPDENAEDARQNLAAGELSEQIQRILFELPEHQRIAIILLRYDQMSYEDIARTMNLSLEAVKSLLSRAKENLKNKLRPILKE